MTVWLSQVECQLNDGESWNLHTKSHFRILDCNCDHILCKILSVNSYKVYFRVRIIWSMKCLMLCLFQACMHACLWNQCCLETTHYFFKIWHNDTWSKFFKKILIGTEFRGTFCFAQKWEQWAKISETFEKKNLWFFL